MTHVTERTTTRPRMSAADRRVAILDAARMAFADTGYHETALGTVAERAGVSKALLYEHFDSKRDLFVAMLDEHADELIQKIGEAVLGAEPGEPRLRAGLEAFFGFVQERRGAWQIMFRNAGDPEVALRLDRVREQVAAFIVQVISEEAQSRGLEVAQSPEMVEMAARQLVGAMQSLADWWDLHRKVPREEVMQAAMDFAWIGQERLSRGERWDA